MARSKFSLRFLGEVDERLRPEAIAFARWIREWYAFDTPFELRLIGEPSIVDNDGEAISMRWWQSDRASSRVVVELAVGTFPTNLEVDGADVAYPTVLCAMARSVKYYFQLVRHLSTRKDVADRWGDAVYDAYMDDAKPPVPYRGATLR